MCNSNKKPITSNNQQMTVHEGHIEYNVDQDIQDLTVGVDPFFDIYFKELLKLDDKIIPECEGDCDLTFAYNSEGYVDVINDPFYRYYHQLYLVRTGKCDEETLEKFAVFLTDNRTIKEKFDVGNGSSIIEDMKEWEEKVDVDVDPIDILISQRDLGGAFIERPEGSTELSTKDILDQGISIDDIEDLIEELGMIEYGFITPEILYLLLYDDDFFEEIANEIEYQL